MLRYLVQDMSLLYLNIISGTQGQVPLKPRQGEKGLAASGAAVFIFPSTNEKVWDIGLRRSSINLIA